MLNKKSGKWYPFAIVKGKPVSTDTVAEILAKRSTVSRADCFAVLKDMGEVVGELMAQGKSVRLEGLGTFRLTIDAEKGGADTADKVDATMIAGVRVRFVPETSRRSDGSISTRAGVSDNIEWVKLDGTAAAGGETSGGDDASGEEDPLG